VIVVAYDGEAIVYAMALIIGESRLPPVGLYWEPPCVEVEISPKCPFLESIK